MTQSALTILCVSLTLCGAIATEGCARSPQKREARFLASGNKYFAQKDYARALLDYKNAAQVMKTDAEPLYRLALTYVAMNEPKSSIPLLNRAIALNPKHVGAQVKLAELMVLYGSDQWLTSAQQKLQQALAVAPGDVDALDVMALTDLRLGKVDEAKERFQDALDRMPSSLKTSVALARLKLLSSDAAGAEVVLSKAVEAAPKSADAEAALGTLYLTENKAREGEQHLRAAIQRDTHNTIALVGLSNLLFQTRRDPEAVQILKQLSQEPNSRYRHLYGVYLLRASKSDEAIGEFARLAKASPNDRTARARLIQAYMFLNRPAEAEKVVNAALKENSRDTDALIQRASLRLSGGDARSAEQDLLQASRFQPDSAEIHYLLAKVYQLRQAPERARQELSETLRIKPSSIAARVGLAENLMQAHAPSAALEVLDAAPSRQKDSLPVITERNWVLLAMKDMSALKIQIARALALGRTPEVLVQDGILKLSEKDPRAARASFQQSLDMAPDNPRALAGLLQSYIVEKQRAAGIQAVQAWQIKYKQSPGAQLVAGEVLLAARAEEYARQAFTAAKALDPKLRQADLALAEIDLQEGKVDHALPALQALVKADQNDTATRLRLAFAEERSGNFNAAIEDYRRVVDDRPNDAPVLNNLAYDLAEYANRPDEALGYAQRAKELAPNVPAIDDTIGWVYYRKGLYNSALQYFRTATAKGSDPQFTPETLARCKFHLAMAYCRNGDHEQGQRAFDEAVKLAPQLPEAKVSRELLAALSQSRMK